LHLVRADDLWPNNAGVLRCFLKERNMSRPHLMAVVVTMALGASALVAARQADQAWLLLTTGERVDGLVSAAATRGQTTIDRTGFVVEDGGRTTRIPFAQVAVIDFTSGQRPTATELLSLPESGHLLVLTNGTTRPGRLLDFSGNVVRWQPVRGQSFNVPMRDVHRIYLDLDRSYELAQGLGGWGQRRGGFSGIFGRGRGAGVAGRAGNDDGPSGGKSGSTDNAASGGKSGGASASSGGKAAGPGDADGIAVLADQPWTDTGLNVKVGQMVRFEAQGRIIFSQGNQNITGPGGAPQEGGSRFPVPSLGIGGLIGKIGPTGRPFAIGATTQPIRMPGSGRLMLGVNDDHYDDNSGAFRVNVNR
jgi:hypothetical protein